jgi:hypothetical protein
MSAVLDFPAPPISPVRCPHCRTRKNLRAQARRVVATLVANDARTWGAFAERLLAAAARLERIDRALGENNTHRCIRT